MTNIKCEICGNQLSCEDNICSECGTKLKPLIGDVNGDGKVDYKDALAAVQIVKDKASEAADIITDAVKRSLKP